MTEEFRYRSKGFVNVPYNWYKYKRGTLFFDRDPDSISGLLLPCYHAGCFRIARSTLSDSLVYGTAYRFEPLPSQIRQRESALLGLMLDRLRCAWPQPHLPVEVWLKITPFLLHESAAALAVEAMMSAPELVLARYTGLFSTLDLSQNVYASYVKFEGVRYVKLLRNATAQEAREGEYLLLDAAKHANVCHVHIAFDICGIRQVQFASSGRILPKTEPVRGLWWRRLSIPEGLSKIYHGPSGVSNQIPEPLLPAGTKPFI